MKYMYTNVFHTHQAELASSFFTLCLKSIDTQSSNP